MRHTWTEMTLERKCPEFVATQGTSDDGDGQWWLFFAGGVILPHKDKLGDNLGWPWPRKYARVLMEAVSYLFQWNNVQSGKFGQKLALVLPLTDL